MSQLTDLLSNRISGNIISVESLSQISPEIQSNIDLFSPICTNIDNQIISIASSIVTIQNEIVGLSTNAYTVGCGTTGGSTTVYPDTVKNYSYNLCNQNYVEDSPYTIIIQTLNSSNSGIGTYLLYTQNDSSLTGIGTLYSNIDTCNRPLGGCTSGICASYASSITAKQNQIVTLRNQLIELVSSSNKIKTERVNYEIQRYGNNYTIRILTNENNRISLAITAIQNLS